MEGEMKTRRQDHFTNFSNNVFKNQYKIQKGEEI